MKLVEEDNDMIPQYKFELVAFSAIQEKVGNTKILTDKIHNILTIINH